MTTCEPTPPRWAAVITDLCRYIEAAEQPPTLEELAQRAGWSRYHLQRKFKAITGLSPRGYAAAVRSAKVRQELKSGESVTEAIYQSGYNSSGRFYEASGQMLGMTPSRYRAGGADTDIHFAVGECSLGSILVARSAKGVCAIYLGDDPNALAHALEDQFPAANLLAGDREFEQVVAQVVGFVESPELGLDLPLDIRGTAFQQRVWELLRQIPIGQTLSYAEVAKRLGNPNAVRAVAGACAANRLAVVIPCHRVVRSDGSLSGYRWGVERKKMLLERES
ncbi:bifunctional transcriptional activator/DNA repair enzyme AdaA [Marinimicrobium agarilyticum]|uniref:bifunctional transcriptional activator/DNA repair enzyme AdaA n=1 Tax=Marinimicrobium agarilyticum TaxID=306546 RepID=UPI00041BF893|nr:methylated-DNA--[protein]-cysteine S-methyltransferase [Marinimicrobium agarilyticum]